MRVLEILDFSDLGAQIKSQGLEVLTEMKEFNDNENKQTTELAVKKNIHRKSENKGR